MDERASRLRAVPLRRRTGWSADGTMYQLECGHTIEPEPFVYNSSALPCLRCYEEAMKKARVLVDGDSGDW
ncbi:MAG: hypothetical protein V4671_06420 [Armatimonadota bacterium]